MSLHDPIRLTGAQCRTLTALACDHEVAVEPLANPGKRGPLVAFADDLAYYVDEDGTLKPHEEAA